MAHLRNSWKMISSGTLLQFQIGALLMMCKVDDTMKNLMASAHVSCTLLGHMVEIDRQIHLERVHEREQEKT